MWTAAASWDDIPSVKSSIEKCCTYVCVLCNIGRIDHILLGNRNSVRNILKISCLRGGGGLRFCVPVTKKSFVVTRFFHYLFAVVRKNFYNFALCKIRIHIAWHPSSFWRSNGAILFPPNSVSWSIDFHAYPSDCRPAVSADTLYGESLLEGCFFFLCV